MPNRIAPGSAVAVSPHDEPQAPSEGARSRIDSVCTWTAAAEHIEERFGWGVLPDMHSIDDDFAHLHGHDLLHVMERLEEHGRLDPILNKMDAGERQALINRAVAGDLIERESPPSGKLVAKVALPAAFSRLLDDLNALGPQRTAPTTYDWSAAGVDAIDGAKRAALAETRSLRPGDTLQVSVKGGAAVAKVDVGLELIAGVTRGSDGTWRAYVENGADVGVAVKGHVKLAEGKASASAGGSIRLEYAYASPEEALAAAVRLASAPSAASAMGRPAAVELKGKAGAQAATCLGPQVAQLAKLAAKMELDESVRLELDHENPEVVFRLGGKLSGSGNLMLGNHHLGEVEVHNVPSARVESRVVAEARFALPASGAFVQDPMAYLREHGESVAANGKYTARISEEYFAGHHGRALDAKLTVGVSDLAGFLENVEKKSVAASLQLLGRRAQVDVIEREIDVKHAGFGGKLLSVDADIELERKSFHGERRIFSGTAEQAANALR